MSVLTKQVSYAVWASLTDIRNFNDIVLWWRYTVISKRPSGTIKLLQACYSKVIHQHRRPQPLPFAMTTTLDLVANRIFLAFNSFDDLVICWQMPWRTVLWPLCCPTTSQQRSRKCRSFSLCRLVIQVKTCILRSLRIWRDDMDKALVCSDSKCFVATNERVDSPVRQSQRMALNRE